MLATGMVGKRMYVEGLVQRKIYSGYEGHYTLSLIILCSTLFFLWSFYALIEQASAVLYRVNGFSLTKLKAQYEFMRYVLTLSKAFW